MKRLISIFATLLLTLSMSIGIVSFADTQDGEVKLWTVSDAIEVTEAINLTGYQIYEENTVVKARSYVDNKTYTLTVLEGDEDNGSYMTAKLPLIAPNGLFDIWVENSHGTTSSLVLNGPRVSWATDDTIYEGVTVYITGRNFDATEYGLAGVKPVVRLVSTTNSNSIYSATIIESESNPYKLAITVGSGVPVGEYYVEVSMGNYNVWSRTDTTQTLSVVTKDTTLLNGTNFTKYAPDVNATWLQNINWNNVVDVSTLDGIQVGSAVGVDATITKGKANYNAIKTAIATLKTQEGGGVLYFPDGDYYINGTIWLYSNIAIVGQSEAGTKIHFINGYYDPTTDYTVDGYTAKSSYDHYNCGFRTDNSALVHDFGIYNFTIDSYGVDNGKGVPDMFIMFSNSNGGLLNGFVSHVTVHGADEYYYSKWSGIKRSVAFNLNSSNASVYDGRYYSGGHIYISDCTFTGITGTTLQLYSREYLTIINNHFTYQRGASSSYTNYSYYYGNVIDGMADDRLELPSGYIKSATASEVKIDVTAEEQAIFSEITSDAYLYMTVLYPSGTTKSVQIDKANVTFADGVATLPLASGSSFSTIPTDACEYQLRDSVDIHGFMHRSYAYFEDNGIYDMYDYRNVGEAICAEICESYSYGTVISATSNTITVNVNGGPIENIKVMQGRLSVYISTGKGAGQTRTVTPTNIVLNGEVATITIDSAWDIIPDDTSYYSLQEACEDVTYYRNYVNGSTKGILMYCNYNDAVAVDNTLINCAGVGIFAVRVRAVGNYYDEDSETWYYNSTSNEGSNHTRYNSNSRIRVEGNLISGVSPITHICGVRFRGEQGHNDGYNDMIQNTAIEVRNNTIKAGGYWAGTNGKYLVNGASYLTATWVEDTSGFDKERQNIITDEVCIYVNGTIVQISGIAMGLATSSVKENSIINQNALIQGNTVTGAIAGVFVGQSVKGVVILDNDFTGCRTYDFEIEARSGAKDYKSTVKDIAYYANTDTVRYGFNGNAVNAITNISNQYLSVVFPSYTIYYVDGETLVGTQSYTYGESVTGYTAPSKAGYIFVRWTDIPTTMPRNDLVLQAKYVSTSTKYTLTYLDADGTTVLGTQEYVYGATISPLTAPTKTGKTFSKWDGIPTTMPDSAVSVTAVYTTNKVTITYQYTYFNIATGVSETKTQKTRSVDYGYILSYGSTSVSITGYDFGGWTGVAEGTAVTQNITLNAVLTAHTHTVTFNINGEEYTSSTLAYGSTITKPDYTTSTGDVFSDWSDDDIPTYMGDYDVEVNATLKYTIKFMKNATTVYKEIIVDAGATITAPLKNPSKDGYTFDKWVGYTSGMTATGSYTFYAKYTEADTSEESSGCMGAIAMLSAFLGIISLAVVGKKY